MIQTMKNLFFVFFVILMFSACNPAPNKGSQTTGHANDSLWQSHKEQGKKIVGMSFKALSQQLQHAISERGLEGALSFCNVHALPITDSLSRAMNVTISRTALKYRNPENAPDPYEEQLMMHFQQMIAQNKKVSDTLVVNEQGEMVYFAPILTLPACLQCHGAPEVEIKPQTMQLVRSLYPDDRAIGFREGDLRGMWKVKFTNGGINTK